MLPQPAQNRRLSDRALWFLVFLFIFLGSAVAGWNYVPSSASRRGGTAESAFAGLGYILGQPYDNDDAGLVLTGRFLVFLGLAVAGFTLWRRFRKTPKPAPHAAVKPRVPSTNTGGTLKLPSSSPTTPPGTPSANDQADHRHQPQSGQQGFPNPFNQRSDHRK